MRRRFVQVDVFGDGPYQGNPLAVVIDAEGLGACRRNARRLRSSASASVTATLSSVRRHQGSVVLAVDHARWGASLAATHAEIHDTGGQGAPPAEERVDAHTVLDAAARLEFTESSALSLRPDNLLNSAYIGSRGAYGLRPGKPRALVLGDKHHFGG